jgi:hypothetical protein
VKARDLKPGDVIDGWTVTEYIYAERPVRASDWQSMVLLRTERVRWVAKDPCPNCFVHELVSESSAPEIALCLGCGDPRPGATQTYARRTWYRSDEEVEVERG